MQSGREGALKERGRMAGGREEAREEAMMQCQERASMEEVTVEGGRVDEWNERGRDGTRHGRREEGGSMGAREGGKLQWR